MNGDSYFSNELLRKIITHYGRSATTTKPLNHDNLTIREIEVLQQICLGLSTEEIAAKLFISPKTVKSHKSNLLEKTVCKNTPALILFAIKNKLVDI
jgi:DNA-binding NarL/FixJ family response regulator